MDVSQHLQKRHGSPVNVDVANVFTAIFFALFISYSVLTKLHARFGLKLDRVLRIVHSPIFQVLVWTALCAFGIFTHFTSNMYDLARRYGQLSLASATITTFLALKPAPLPQTFHAPLVTLHKWIGRTSIAFAVAHGAIYMGAYIASVVRSHHKNESSHDKREFYEQAFSKRHGGHSFFSAENIYGMAAVVAFLIILISSLKFVRRRVYNVFYSLHRPLVILIYILMIWHSRPSSWLLVPLGLSLMAAQIVVRIILTSRLNIVSIERFGSSLLLVSFKCDNGLIDFSQRGSTFSNRDLGISQESEPSGIDNLVSNSLHKPGTYIRVSRPVVNPLEFFKASHPYTLAGPGKLVIRESRRFRLDETLEYCAYGPFGSSLDLSSYTHILVIAGGSGIATAPSVVENAKDKVCHVVWATRNSGEAAILPHLSIDNCSVYITSQGVGAVKYTEEEGYELESTEFDIDDDEDTVNSGTNRDHGGEARTNADDQEALLQTEKPLRPGIHQYSGRPDLEKIASAFYKESATSKLCVVSCGPETLVAEVSKWCNNNKHDSWTEVFAL